MTVFVDTSALYALLDRSDTSHKRAVSAWVDFLNSLCSYVGLIPAIKSSGETEYVRGITPRRNAYVRWILIEAAWVAVRKDPAMMMAFNEYCKRMRKNKAIVKIARKLLNRIRYILKHQTPYVPCVAK